MTKQLIIDKIYQEHQVFLDFIDSLTLEEFMTNIPLKWTAGQQLEHIFKSLKPLTKVLASKAVVEERFGKIDREIWQYDQVIAVYNHALENGGAASPPFLPDAVEMSQKAELMRSIAESLKILVQHLEAYTENDLDTLVVPHPLLGKMTIREMLYFTAHHVGHHYEKTKQNLGQDKA